MTLHTGTESELKPHEPFDLVLHPVERRGGSWGWFQQSLGACPFMAYGAKTRRDTRELQKARAELAASKGLMVALIQDARK